jgi:hypothetical protein
MKDLYLDLSKNGEIKMGSRLKAGGMRDQVEKLGGRGFNLSLKVDYRLFRLTLSRPLMASGGL